MFTYCPEDDSKQVVSRCTNTATITAQRLQNSVVKYLSFRTWKTLEKKMFSQVSIKIERISFPYEKHITIGDFWCQMQVTLLYYFYIKNEYIKINLCWHNNKIELLCRHP